MAKLRLKSRTMIRPTTSADMEVHAMPRRMPQYVDTYRVFMEAWIWKKNVFNSK